MNNNYSCKSRRRKNSCEQIDPYESYNYGCEQKIDCRSNRAYDCVSKMNKNSYQYNQTRMSEYYDSEIRQYYDSEIRNHSRYTTFLEDDGFEYTGYGYKKSCETDNCKPKEPKPIIEAKITNNPELACVVCMTNQRDTCCKTCSHMSMCWTCSNNLNPKKCPICRCDFTKDDLFQVIIS